MLRHRIFRFAGALAHWRALSTGVPDDVAELIAGHIDSVEKLEILLFLRGGRDRAWTPDQVSRELRRNAASTARCMAQLEKGGLLERTRAGECLFAPDPGLETRVDRLAASYAARRVSVVQLIVSNPMDSVATFSDPSRFRRKP